MTPLSIPQRLANRPTQGGLVVPWISVQLGDQGFDLGNMHTSRVNTCFYQKRCQICGDRIHGRIVFFLTDSALTDMHAGEPPLHPECAAYSARACPMLAGRMRHYRTSLSRAYGPAGAYCDKPGCDCAGWQPSPDASSKAGQPAERWNAVWCADYTLTVPDEETAALIGRGAVPTRKMLGARIDHPLKVRPVRTAGAEECPA